MRNDVRNGISRYGIFINFIMRVNPKRAWN